MSNIIIITIINVFNTFPWQTQPPINYAIAIVIATSTIHHSNSLHFSFFVRTVYDNQLFKNQKRQIRVCTSRYLSLFCISISVYVRFCQILTKCIINSRFERKKHRKRNLVKSWQTLVQYPYHHHDSFYSTHFKHFVTQWLRKDCNTCKQHCNECEGEQVDIMIAR